MPSQPTEFLPGVPDWSTVHEPTGKLFTNPKTAEDWSKFKFSQQQVDQFWNDGFLFNIPVLTAEQCDMIIEDYKYFTGEKKHPGSEMMYEFHSNQTGDTNNVLMHALGHWRLTELFHDLAFLPQVVTPASQLLVKDKTMAVRFWHDQLFAKPAKHGGCVAWFVVVGELFEIERDVHNTSDYSYWTRTSPMQHLTVHIALDDQTLENGALHYIPGSHRWTRNNGAPLPVTDFNFADMESIHTILNEDEEKQFKPVCGQLKKGEASFHHPLTVHGSYGNRSEVPRRAAVLNYFADGVCSNSDEEILKNIRIPKGEKMCGQFFPLVFDPACMKV